MTPANTDFVIEDVASQSFVYTRNAKASKNAHAKVANSVGRCQQAQIELVRVLEASGFDVYAKKPTRGNWATNKKHFLLVTGWEGHSNQETRSAAFMGWLLMNSPGYIRKSNAENS